MAGLLLRRLVSYVVLALVATFLAFTLASATFDPIGVLQERNPPPPAATIEAKKKDLHLDQPIPQRFVTWMSGVVRGDFGRTVAERPVGDELGRRIWVSLRLFLLGITFGIVFGVLLGVVSAIRQYRFSDYLATLFSFLLPPVPPPVPPQARPTSGPPPIPRRPGRPRPSRRQPPNHPAEPRTQRHQPPPTRPRARSSPPTPTRTHKPPACWQPYLT